VKARSRRERNRLLCCARVLQLSFRIVVRPNAFFENLTLSIYERKLDAPFLPVQGGNALTAALQAAAEVSRGVQLTRMS